MRTRPLEHPEILDGRATIVLTILSAGLSIKWIQGQDLRFLTMDYAAWPQEPWRLLTSCLLHANWFHLIFNLFWTWRFGFVLEPLLGLPAFVGLVVFLGVGSSAAEWAVFQGGIGLSGIGYGFFGLLWALDRYNPNCAGVMERRTTELFVVWFFLCIVLSAADVLPIANVAHGAGAALGALVGIGLSPFERSRKHGRAGLAIVAPLIALACTVGRPYVNASEARAWELAYDGLQALGEGDPQRAVTLLERAVARDPEIAPAWHNLAVAYHRSGRFEEAERAMARSKELRESEPETPGER